MKYLVMNKTDGITAAQPFNTKKEAEQFIKEFPMRYQLQGYYRNNKWEKINPKDVILEIEYIS